MKQERLKNPVPFPFLFWSLILGLTGFACGIFKVATYDIFWHLASGEWMLSQGEVIRANTFSWSHPNHPWTPTYWLFEIIVTWAYHLGGPEGWVWLRALILGLIGLIWGATCARRWPAWLLLLPFFVWIDGSLNRLLLRPHLFSYLGMLCCIPLSRATLSPPSRKILLLLTFLLFSLWSNLHSGVIFGHVFLAILCLSFFLEAFWQQRSLSPFFSKLKSNPAINNILLIQATAWVASGCNPGGFGWLGYILDHLTLSQWFPLEEFGSFQGPIVIKMGLVFICLYGIPLMLLFSLKKQQIFPLLIGMWSLWLLAQGIRFLPLAILLSLVPLHALVEALPPNPRPIRHRSFSILAPPLLALLFIFWTHCYAFPQKGSYLESGLGLHEISFPMAATEALKPQKPVRCYTSFSIGGYLLHHSRASILPFQDGRIHAYPKEFLKQVHLAGQDMTAWVELHQIYNFDGILMDKYEDPVALSLKYSGKWKTLYEDEVFWAAIPQTRTNDR